MRINETELRDPLFDMLLSKTTVLTFTTSEMNTIKRAYRILTQARNQIIDRFGEDNDYDTFPELTIIVSNLDEMLDVVENARSIVLNRSAG